LHVRLAGEDEDLHAAVRRLGGRGQCGGEQEHQRGREKPRVKAGSHGGDSASKLLRSGRGSGQKGGTGIVPAGVSSLPRRVPRLPRRPSMKRRIALGLSAFAAVILPVPELLPEEKAPPRTPVEAGKPAPDFTLRDESGKDIKLSSFAGKKSVLLAFYAKDFTPGCTSELKGFR